MLVVLLAAGIGLSCGGDLAKQTQEVTKAEMAVVQLPEPNLKGDMSLEEALLERRSVREYDPGALTLDQVSQLLWAAQGITGVGGGRTAPSAGALYPLEVLVVAGSVDGLSPGVYRYDPPTHELNQTRQGDSRAALAAVALDQEWVRQASISLVIAAVYERTTAKYGERGVRYVHMEAGHAAQNVCLQATALGLGAVTVGAFDDSRVKNAVGLAANEEPLYIIPLGRKHQ